MATMNGVIKTVVRLLQIIQQGMCLVLAQHQCNTIVEAVWWLARLIQKGLQQQVDIKRLLQAQVSPNYLKV